jgi:tyrosine-protein phosphatase YwqE
MFGIFHKNKEDVKLFCHTDVHCHILPGVDHGSQNVEMSLQMLEAEMDMGIDRVICTSHVTAETFENTVESLTGAGKALQQAIDAAGFDIKIYVSAEYRLDEYWNKEYSAGHILAMPGNYILLENSFQQELLELDDTMFDLQVKGYKPILAHPERYGYYGHRHSRYEQLHNAGVKFQINILSLAGYFGTGARDNALWLIENNFVDMLGTDMHNLDHAQIIKKYLQTKEWRKLSERLEGHILNDYIK